MTTSAREESRRLLDLLRRERTALAEFLVALAEFDRRRAWVELGYASLFWFLHRDLGLSKSAAFYRKTAAELVQRFPEVLDPLRDGRLCLTSVAEIAKVLTQENLSDVLPRFFTLSTREAKEVTAALLPTATPPLRDAVTLVRERATAPAAPSSPPPALWAAPAATSSPSAVPTFAAALPLSSGSAQNLPRANSRVPDEASASPVSPTRPAFEIEPLTAELRRLHITVSRRLLDKLETARDALSHSHPGAARDEILEVGLDLILERQAKRRGLVKNPRKKVADADTSTPAATPTPAVPSSTPTPAATPTPNPASSPRSRSRCVPAEVRREVWARDGGRCQWPLQGGGLCGSTYRVELDHVVPVGLGGASTPGNLRCLCDGHNDLAAREAYGDELMDRFRRPPTAREPVAAWVT